MRRRTRSTIWLAAVVVTAGAACSDGTTEMRVGDEGPPALGPALFGEGTPIADGISVPPGTQLVGTAFPVPVTDDPDGPGSFNDPPGTVLHGWDALLVVRESPIRAWNDIVRQARAQGIQLGGTDSGCVRRARNNTGVEALSCYGRAAEVAVAGDPRDTLQAAFGYAPDSASGELNFRRAVADETTTEEPLTVVDEGLADGLSGPAGEGGFAVETGEPFGPEHGCFEHGEYDRFRLPPRAAVAGEVAGQVVLAAEDAEAVIRDLLGQLLGENEPDDQHTRLGTVPTGDGGTIFHASHGVDDDGGASLGGFCELRSNLDRDYVLIAMHPG